MANSGLFGPHPLTEAGIQAYVKGVSGGAYALGKTENGTFLIHYVGRSDVDLAARLRQHTPKWYPEFKYGFLASSKAAFEKECRLYHDFTPPDNTVHPARPQNENWACPACSFCG